jgi:CO/xanthine dehydrogenase FAD-binding subunit
MKPDDLNQDIHATREYRANLVNVMTKRAAAHIAGGK